MIPFLDLGFVRRELEAELDSAYERVMSSGRWILGEELVSFESSFASFCGNDYCVGTGSGTDAIKISLRALGIGPGDEVIVPANTCVPTWSAVAEVGATPVACEPDEGSYNISAAGIEPLIGKRTRAVIPVHLYGIPVDMNPIMDLAGERGIRVVEDAAQAHGAEISGRHAGGFGHMGAFSFYPSKNLGAFGDGGAIVTSDEALAGDARRLRNYGGLGQGECEMPGFNSRLDELQAAFLSVRLKRLEEWNERRRVNAAMYSAALESLPDVVLPTSPSGSICVWHMFVVQCEARDALRARLAENGVETGIHYPAPVYRLPAYVRAAPESESRSDEYSRRILSLPIGPELNAENISYICGLISEFYS